MSSAVETDGILRIHQALLHLQHGLAPFVAARMEARFGANWRDHSRRGAGNDALDAYALLRTMIDHWGEAFAPAFGLQERHSIRSHVTHALEGRNAAAHATGAIPDAAALRAIDAVLELLKAAGAPAATLAAVQALYDAQRQPRAVPQARPTAMPRSAAAQPSHATALTERLLAYVRMHPDLDDDELAQRLGVSPRQAINQAARKLAAAGRLQRFVGPNNKLVNRATGD